MRENDDDKISTFFIMVDYNLLNYDKLTGIDNFSNFELDMSNFNYKDMNGIDYAYLECETKEDYYIYYQNKNPHYGHDLWNALAQYDTKKLSRQEMKAWAKTIKKQKQRIERVRLEHLRQGKIADKLKLTFD